MIVDLADLQWWQAFIAIVGALGLSPAPWLLGMALNRIQFTAPARAAYDERIAELKSQYDERVADLKAQHAATITALTEHHTEVVAGHEARYSELRQSRDYYREARIVERDRADKVTDQLAEALELARLNTHLLESLDEAAKDGAT